MSFDNWYLDPRLDKARAALSLTEQALSKYEDLNDGITGCQELWRRLAGVCEAHQLMAQAQGLVQARLEAAKLIDIVDDAHKKHRVAYLMQLRSIHKIAAEVLDELVFMKALGCGLLGSGLWTPGPCALVSGVWAPGSEFCLGSQREREREIEDSEKTDIYIYNISL